MSRDKNSAKVLLSIRAKIFPIKSSCALFLFSFLIAKRWIHGEVMALSSFRRNATRSLDCGGKSRGKFFAEEVFSKERERKNNFHSVTGGWQKQTCGGVIKWNLEFLSSAGGKRVLKGENEKKILQPFFFFSFLCKVAPRMNINRFVIYFWSQKHEESFLFLPSSQLFNSSIFIKRKRNII